MVNPLCLTLPDDLGVCQALEIQAGAHPLTVCANLTARRLCKLVCAIFLAAAEALSTCLQFCPGRLVSDILIYYSECLTLACAQEH